jgi:hypothetical protein
MTDTAVLLLVLLFAAHFVGDFTPLSTPRMHQAKAVGTPLGPIAAHAAVHAILVGTAVLVAARPAVALVALAAGIAFATHLAIDWARGRLGAGRPALFIPDSQAFWSALGLDQLAHGMVLIGIAALVV